MIKVKMYEGKWQIHIGEEIWEFENLKEMQENLTKILRIKDKHGRIK